MQSGQITGKISNTTLRGYSAYDVAVLNGFEGSEAEWLASLKGETGEHGINGKDGKDGANGTSITNVVLTNTSGNVDTYTIYYSNGTTSTFLLRNGVNGVNGKDGVNGIDGKDGKDGEKGDVGNGIKSITRNADYTLTITMDDGTQYTTDPIRGEKGETGDTGNGISNVVLNPDYTLTITFTDGTEYTTTSIRGVKGETGTSITDITLNPNYTLTITMSDGETYTTDPIRGAKGETGTSITNVTLNPNYTLTITMSDGTSYATGSIRGAKGDKGDTGSKGDKGTSISSVTKTGTSGLVDTYTITYDDGTTSTFTVTNGQNATVEVTSDTDSDYRLTFTDVNGSIETPNLYSDVTASAKQLLSDSYTLDQVPYLFRKSPDSDRAVESIVGGTVGWNQLVQNGDFSDGTTGWSTSANFSLTASNNTGIFTVTVESGTSNPMARPASFSLIKGHKYLFAEDITPQVATTSTRILLHSGSDTIKNYQIGAIASGNKNRFRCIDMFDNDYATCQIRTYFDYNHGENGSVYHLNNVQTIDLTTMFGTTIADYIYSLEQSTAGAGVAKLKEWGFFTEDYYEYCLPTLRSVEGLQSKKTVGFNQWDEEWEVGAYNANTGVKTTWNGAIRSIHKLKCCPNTAYCLTFSSTPSLYIYWYDASDNYLGYNKAYNSGTIFTSPANAQYFTTGTYNDYGTTYNHDICINLSDPTRNGQYEPYESHSYPLDSTLTLRGVPKLDSNNNLYFDGDLYPADGQGKRRYGVMVLNGTENWVGSSANGYYIAFDSLKKISNVGGYVGHMLADKVPIGTWAEEGTLHGYSDSTNRFPNQNWLYYFNQTLSSAADVKSYFASNPVTVVYPLSTPTTFTATPYHNPQIVGDTEEFVTTGIVPVGHATRYYQNLRKKIENLPWNFSSLIAPTEVTNKATRNYTTGSYLILNNVLYKVTSNIANGGNITPNTNCTATTIMSEIMAL